MHRQSFNSDWYFHFGDAKGNFHQHVKLDLSEWQPVNLPHDWSITLPRNADAPSSNSGGYFPMGRGNYLKMIDVPQSWQDKKVLLEFEGVYMNTEIWLDDHFILRYPYGYTTFLVDLTPYLKFGQSHVLKLRVDNSSQLNSRWYSGSGVYRPVWLIVAEPVHVAHWGIYVITPEVSETSALVRVQTTIENDADQLAEVLVRSRIVAPEGEVVATYEVQTAVPIKGRVTEKADLQVRMPLLWSPQAPHLYSLETEVVMEGQVLDAETTTFGIRDLHFSAEDGFLLNGEVVKLKGGCVHHDNGVLGAASFPRSEERKVEIHKASGYNAIRCAHNPPAPSFLDACDRLGMLVIDEAFDCWRDGKNFYDYHINFDDWWQRDLDAMIMRDRNHPSVIIWSIGNEILERDRPEGASIAQMLAERVHSVDPTRPVTAAICGSWAGKPWENTEGVFAKLDIGGYNYQWKQYKTDHQRFPERMMIGTESFPLEAFDNWDSVMKHPHILGDFVWTSLDYLGESGIGRERDSDDTEFLGKYPWHQANCGDLDLCGYKRPQSYYRDILWNVGTNLYIAVHPPVKNGKIRTPTLWGWPDVWPNWNWPDYEGESLKVDIYSACDEVELILNGRSLGRKSSSLSEQHIATFDVPYEPGELKAVGYQDGQTAAEKILHTCSLAKRICLTADRAQIMASEGDLSYITVEILDESGQVHPAADRLINFTLTGPGKLLAVGNSNPTSEENYQGCERTTFRGRCLAVVQSTGAFGEAILRSESEGLEPAEIKIAFE